jgi:prolyl-tRNA editing enzyme YbaK/EbsC (Cys-tRNA(Pro) deacylase)
MSVDQVRAYFTSIEAPVTVLEFQVSTATVDLAAEAVGVIPARIAKTLSFRCNEGGMLIVTAGDAKMDNVKFKNTFGYKARMLSAEELETYIGLPVGGVCPFGLKTGTPVYLDVSMKRFATIFPAAGSAKSAVELSCDQLFDYSKALGWVDVCKEWC